MMVATVVGGWEEAEEAFASFVGFAQIFADNQQHYETRETIDLQLT